MVLQVENGYSLLRMLDYTVKLSVLLLCIENSHKVPVHAIFILEAQK